MVKLLPDSQSPFRISLLLLAIGAVLGFMHFVVTLMLARYVVDPFACGSIGDQCAQSLSISDGITVILVAIAGIFLGIRYMIARPLMVSVSSALLLAGIMSWIGGLFWLEALAWAVLLYSLSYLLFGWINRYQILGYIIIVTAIILISQRVVLTY